MELVLSGILVNLPAFSPTKRNYFNIHYYWKWPNNSGIAAYLFEVISSNDFWIWR